MLKEINSCLGSRRLDFSVTKVVKVCVWSVKRLVGSLPSPGSMNYGQLLWSFSADQIGDC